MIFIVFTQIYIRNLEFWNKLKFGTLSYRVHKYSKQTLPQKICKFLTAVFQ